MKMCPNDSLLLMIYVHIISISLFRKGDLMSQYPDERYNTSLGYQKIKMWVPLSVILTLNQFIFGNYKDNNCLMYSL